MKRQDEIALMLAYFELIAAFEAFLTESGEAIKLHLSDGDESIESDPLEFVGVLGYQAFHRAKSLSSGEKRRAFSILEEMVRDFSKL